MIVILTDIDLDADSGDISFDEVSLSHVDEDLWRSLNWADDVYFWRNTRIGSIIKALKRHNALLEVPEWLKDRKGVDM